ncbi:MAG: 3-phosphoshikimate 1-carboxyvinyltransferase, partial [Ilumatobacteraceae bacterium]
TVPGSKSIANRALVCAALADGESQLRGVPDGDDTASMIECLGALGVGVSVSVGDDAPVAVVAGGGGRLTGEAVQLHAGLAGTTSRFVTAVAALASGSIVVDGDPPLRARPMGPLHDALAGLGATITPGERAGHLPVTVRGPLSTGGRVELPGDVSSQYLTALMLIAPMLDGGLHLELTTPLVSRPYVDLTASVMAAFGMTDVAVDDRSVVVAQGRYRATAFTVEPDASSASYPLAMAAVGGGRVEVRGLLPSSPQGDVRFADLLGRMGCTVIDGVNGLGIERLRWHQLNGIDADLTDVSDLVPTLAAVAATASSPTTITGVDFIRAKESDRLTDLAGELIKTGARISVEAAGLRIDPTDQLHGAVLATHHDHRLAMAFGVLATAVAGIEVLDPGVVAKSWPAYWQVRDEMLPPL